MHLVTRLHQYLPYLSYGKGGPNWYWALGQEAETITKMNEIKGKTIEQCIVEKPVSV